MSPRFCVPPTGSHSFLLFPLGCPHVAPASVHAEASLVGVGSFATALEVVPGAEGHLLVSTGN